MLQFRQPEFEPRFRRPTNTAPMRVPKTAIHKNNLSARREYDVGSTRKIATVKPESVTERVKTSANQQFRCCVLAANA
jgi:hypothetical protein